MSLKKVRSNYRILGFDEKGQAMLLYDIDNDGTVWVNVTGYNSESNSIISQFDQGNRITAEIQQPQSDEPWTMLDFSVKTNERLFYEETSGSTLANTDELWSQSDSIMQWHEVKDKNHRCEIVIEHQGSRDGIDHVYEALLNGNLVPEPFYNSEGCEYIDGAQAVFAINRTDSEYVVFYLVPDLDPSGFTGKILRDLKSKSTEPEIYENVIEGLEETSEATPSVSH